MTPGRPPVGEVPGWRLVELLGRGGLSEVWSAEATEHRGDGLDRAAIKLLRNRQPSEAELRRFLQEGLILQQVSGPGLPCCLGHGREPEPYIVLEELVGSTLAERLERDGPLSVSDGLGLAEELLAVLAHLHSHGVIHRDIKPANLFITRAGRLKVMDLGLAHADTGHHTTTLGDVMGTWTYMAPEQLVGAEVDPRCDLFAVGVTLYEALSGRFPVQADDPTHHLESLRDGLRVPLLQWVPALPVRLASTIERLMAWDPDARPHSASVARARILGERSVGWRTRAEMVGRAGAQGAVEAALDARISVLLIGGAGSGIERMRTWSIRCARKQGFDVINLRVSAQAAGAMPGMVDLLARELERFTGAAPASLSEVTACLRALSQEGPLLVMIEAAGLLGEGAIADLDAVVGRCPELAVVWTSSRELPQLACHRVHLRALSVRETGRLVASLLDTISPPAGFGGSLHHVTGGLPGLVTLAVRELVDQGALWADGVDEHGETRWHLDRTVSLEPTAGLARLFGRVIGRLPPPARRLMESLAVAGQPTSVDVILRAADVSRSEALVPLVDTGLVSVEAYVEGDRLSLSRGGLALLVVRQLAVSERSLLSARLAEALAQAPDAVWLEPQIRWHRALGGQGAEAARELLSIGDDLRERGQLGASADVLQQAAIRCPPAAHPLMAEICYARGRVRAAMCRWKEARADLTRAIDHAAAEPSPQPVLQWAATIDLARVMAADEDPLDASSTLERLIDRMDEQSQPGLAARAMTLAAEQHRRAAHPVASRRLLSRALEAARRSGDGGLVALVEGAQAHGLIEAGRVTEGRRLLETQVDLLRFTGRTHELIPVLYRLAVALRREGRIDRSMEVLDEADDVGRYAHRPHDRALALVGRAGVLLAIHELDGADALLARAREAVDAEAPPSLRLAFRDVQLGTRLERGDTAAALSVAQVAEAEAVRAGHAVDAAFHLGVVGVLTADTDAIGDALDVLDTAGDRRLAARLLLAGALQSRDVDVLASAESEARASGDRLLMLKVLHAVGSSGHRAEAEALCAHLLPNIPLHLRARFADSASVRWAAPELHQGATALTGRRAPLRGGRWRDHMRVDARSGPPQN